MFVFFTVELEFKHVNVITGTFMKSCMVIKRKTNILRLMVTINATLNCNKQHIPTYYIHNTGMPTNVT